MALTAAIIVPTRRRAGYLARALASIAEQAREAGIDVLVVDDAPDPETRAAAGRVLWVPGAALDHVRSGDDATVRALARAAYARGQASRRYDVFKGRTPSLAHELALLARTVVHGPLHRCSNGPVMAAHSL